MDGMVENWSIGISSTTPPFQYSIIPMSCQRHSFGADSLAFYRGLTPQSKATLFSLTLNFI
jgi:hypothetical protein